MGTKPETKHTENKPRIFTISRPDGSKVLEFAINPRGPGVTIGKVVIENGALFLRCCRDDYGSEGSVISPGCDIVGDISLIITNPVPDINQAPPV